MNTRPVSSARSKRGGKILPALCNLVGTLILLAVIGSCLPMILPQFLGYQIYNIVSGSMAPEIPVGSVVYVESAQPETVVEGDVIAFFSGNTVITHRVVANRTLEGVFTTKGDANEGEDLEAVPYQALIGRVVWHAPLLGGLMEIYTSTVGKVYALLLAACGAMFNMLAGRMREYNRNRE